MQQARLRIALDLVAGWLTFLMRGIRCLEDGCRLRSGGQCPCPDRAQASQNDVGTVIQNAAVTPPSYWGIALPFAA